MSNDDIMRQLEFEHHAIQAASPDRQTSLWNFLRSRGATPDDIWEYSPQTGYDAGQPEPEWV